MRITSQKSEIQKLYSLLVLIYYQTRETGKKSKGNMRKTLRVAVEEGGRRPILSREAPVPSGSCGNVSALMMSMLFTNFIYCRNAKVCMEL